MKIIRRLLMGYGFMLVLLIAGVALLVTAAADWRSTPHQQLLWLGACGFGLFAAGLILAFVVARSANRSLERIALAARSIAEGRFDVRVGRSRLGETDTLTEKFNEMAQALESYNSSSIDRLLAEQRRNEAVLTCIDDGIIIFDGEARIERVSPVAARQLGVEPAQATGRTLDQVLGRSRFDARILECLQQQLTPIEPEPDLEMGEGDARRTLSCSLLPFHDLARPGLVMLLRDVTEERQFDRLRNEFVLRASHELRTPVTGLRMALDLLAERRLFLPESREHDLFETVRGESQRLSGLLEDLLDLSRLEQMETPLKPEDCSLSALAEEAHARFVPLALEHEVRLDKDISADLPLLQADSGRLSRVFDNLLANALRHTPKGGNVMLRVRPQSEALRIDVIDNGEGMPRWQLARIFDPFIQYGANTGGAGLGLTLSREIVEQHGGRIDVRSLPGRGTCFTVRLPWPGTQTTATAEPAAAA